MGKSVHILYIVKTGNLLIPPNEYTTIKDQTCWRESLSEVTNVISGLFHGNKKQCELSCKLPSSYGIERTQENMLLSTTKGRSHILIVTLEFT